jgi:hypothetical protein
MVNICGILRHLSQLQLTEGGAKYAHNRPILRRGAARITSAAAGHRELRGAGWPLRFATLQWHGPCALGGGDGP